MLPLRQNGRIEEGTIRGGSIEKTEANSQKFSIEAIVLGIRRDYHLNKLIAKKRSGLIKVTTGMRFCGKSYLLFSLFKKLLQNGSVPADHMIEVAFDSFSGDVAVLGLPASLNSVGDRNDLQFSKTQFSKSEKRD